MKWNSFDADKPEPKMQECISKVIERIIKYNKVIDIDSFVKSKLEDFKKVKSDELNMTIGIQFFRPHEFDYIKVNDDALEHFGNWLTKQKIDWRKGSEILKKLINENFQNTGKTKIKLGETYLLLDNLVEIKGKKIAIEVETSGNLDNGYYTLRQAIKNDFADFGLMITPWTNKPNLADEKKARERLDHEFDGKKDIKDGPIYSIVILRLLDIYLEMKKL